MTAREQVEHGHRTRGEPTYAELQAINAELLAALERRIATSVWKCGSSDCPQPYDLCECGDKPVAAIAKAKASRMTTND